MVVGSGKRDQFDGLIDRYDVRNVDFVGRASAEDLPRYYASCEVFCAPSTSGESFGIVLLEAMASGRPVVAGDIPGYRSVMTNEQEGLLVPPKNNSAIALAIVRLLADQDLRQRMSSRWAGHCPPIRLDRDRIRRAPYLPAGDAGIRGFPAHWS